LDVRSSLEPLLQVGSERDTFSQTAAAHLGGTLQYEHFEAVVVGSGFGGSVSAYRLAEGGRSVCLLERGKPFPPGSFPRSPHGLSKNFWDPSEGLHGMFNIWSFRGIDALVSSGLGGGSLIYANVMIRKDERWFVQDGGAPGGEHWPVTRAELDAHYDRVERMLDVQKYPLHRQPYSETRKTLALKEAAERRGYDWFLPNLAVTFANDGEAPVPGEPIKEEHPNLHGRTRYTCRLVGECNVGCNYGSKNTLDYTYLTHAQRFGADLRTRCEVRAFRPREGGGFEIDYVRHDETAEGHKTETRGLPVQTVDGGSSDRVRGDARLDLPAAREPARLRRPPGRAGHALLRQRRPADVRRQLPRPLARAAQRRPLRLLLVGTGDGRRLPRDAPLLACALPVSCATARSRAHSCSRRSTVARGRLDDSTLPRR